MFERESAVGFKGFTDRLNVRIRKREELRMSPKSLAWALGD